jgi:hypothetical protein
MIRIEPEMTLEDLAVEPAPPVMETIPPRALALAELDAQPQSLDQSSSYTITVCNATGNGTDFGRP